MAHNSDNFMAEFYRTTWQNPFNNRERILFEAAAIALTISGDDEVRINCVRSLTRGAGYGSMALDWLAALADKHGVSLTGTIEPCGDVRPRLNINQLKAWYRRHGFTVVGRHIERLQNERAVNLGAVASLPLSAAASVLSRPARCEDRKGELL